MVNWTADLRQWAFEQAQLHPGSDEEDYAHGVIMAINVYQRKIPPLKEAVLDRERRETQFGYVDGIALMNKVVKLGDAPVGEFRILLGAPHSEPLPTDRKAWDSFRGTAPTDWPFIVGRS
jgi:hypothetical protein